MEAKNLSNVPVLEYYGAVNPPEGPGWKTISCPFHQENRPSARSNGTGFLCNGCGVSGDALKLLMDREGIGYLSAVERYEEISGIECKSLSANASGRRRPFDGELSESPRHYERNGGLFSFGSSKRSIPRKRPRLSEG